jgi:hypothetical protein
MHDFSIPIPNNAGTSAAPLLIESAEASDVAAATGLRPRDSRLRPSSRVDVRGQSYTRFMRQVLIYVHFSVKRLS